MRRGVMLVAAVAVPVTAAAGFVLYDPGGADGAPEKGGPAVLEVDLNRQGQILFRSTASGSPRDHLAAVSMTDPSGPRVVGNPACLQFHAAGGIGVCLRTGEAVILDARLRESRRFKLTGVPARARVSASGRLVAWSSSTRTSVFDTRTSKFYPDLAKFAIVENGRRTRPSGATLGSVTFLPDDNGFYATLSKDRKTYLAFGDLARRTIGAVRENAESPSLSPDGTRLAFVKRGSGTTRLYVLDLRTRRERPLAETAAVDDQAIWMGNGTVMYGRPGPDIWSVPADGSGTPRRLIRSAGSPVPIG